MLPLLVAYDAGLLATGFRGLNGADLVTVLLVTHFGLQGFLVWQGAVLVAFAGGVLYLQHRGQLAWRDFGPLLVESVAWALGMATLILAVLQRTQLMSLAPPGHSLGVIFTLSAGAGVNEEFVFRLLLVPLLAHGFRYWPGLPQRASWATAILVAALIFALAHYATPAAVDAYSFAFRTLAGVVFGLLFVTRGFAVAVYAHFLYDVYALVLA